MRAFKWFAMVALLALVPQSAAAHLKLATSRPAENDTVRSMLDVLELTFTVNIELRFSSVRLLDAAGAEVPLGVLEAHGPKGVRARPLAALRNGRYVVRWRTAGPDGHVVEGSFAFTVDVPQSADSPVLAATTDTSHIITGAEHIRDVNLRPVVVATRWINFIALLLAVGGVAFPLIVLGRARARVPDAAAYWPRVEAVAQRIALIAGVACLLIAVPRLALQSSALHGAGRTWDPQLLTPLLRETSWGRGWLMQVLGSIVYCVGLWLARRERDYLGFAVLALVGLTLAPALSGHAAAVEQTQLFSVLDDALHVLLASAWLGTLAYVLTSLVIAARDGADASHRGAAAVVRAFSPLALAAAGMAVITGGISALSHIGPLTDLWHTAYGRALSLKLLALLVAASLGFFNWRSLTPTLGNAVSTQRLRLTATVELTIAGIILLITAVLVALPTP